MGLSEGSHYRKWPYLCSQCKRQLYDHRSKCYFTQFCIDSSITGVARRLFSGIQFQVAPTVNSTSKDQGEVPELPVCGPSFCGYWFTRVDYIAFVFHIPVEFQIPVHDVTFTFCPVPTGPVLKLVNRSYGWGRLKPTGKNPRT